MLEIIALYYFLPLPILLSLLTQARGLRSSVLRPEASDYLVGHTCNFTSIIAILAMAFRKSRVRVPKEKIQLTFGQLRRGIECSRYFAEDFLGEQGIPLRARPLLDFGLADLDVDFFFEAFGQKYGFDLLEGAEKYLAQRQTSKWRFIGLPLFPLTLLFGILAIGATMTFRWLFRKPAYSNIPRRSLKDLSIGDLAISIAAGKFLKREAVEIVLK